MFKMIFCLIILTSLISFVHCSINEEDDYNYDGPYGINYKGVPSYYPPPPPPASHQPQVDYNQYFHQIYPSYPPPHFTGYPYAYENGGSLKPIGKRHKKKTKKLPKINKKFKKLSKEPETDPGKTVYLFKRPPQTAYKKPSKKDKTKVKKMVKKIKKQQKKHDKKEKKMSIKKFVKSFKKQKLEDKKHDKIEMKEKKCDKWYNKILGH